MSGRYLEWASSQAAYSGSSDDDNSVEGSDSANTRVIASDYERFAGLDVDKKSLAVSFTDHQQLKQALRLPYGVAQLLSYVRKHFRSSAWRLFIKLGPPASGSKMS
jgi:hypothetical protein